MLGCGTAVPDHSWVQSQAGPDSFWAQGVS
jgi:hypothetical protein